MSAVMCKRPGSSWRIGNRDAALKALGVRCVWYGCTQSLLAAEEMRAAGDFKNEPIRRVERNTRRPALAIISEDAEQFGIGRRAGFFNVQTGAQRTRIGERHARRDAEIGRIIVNRADEIGRAHAGVGRKAWPTLSSRLA